jgi:hypothetical protein
LTGEQRLSDSERLDCPRLIAPNPADTFDKSTAWVSDAPAVMLRYVATVLLVFQRFPITPGNSIQHECDMGGLTPESPLGLNPAGNSVLCA